MKKKEIVAMLLAGGQGTRLKSLTKKVAKPAVYFGGNYRIIDFTLSNCSNSGIDTVGVLTQYEPLVLHSYIGIGSDWGLDRKTGGIYVLPPHEKQDGSNWYHGTADAIYRNMTFIEQFDPDHVLILSGDHIYKMDYADMLQAHKDKDADCTISVIEVPLHEASRFGIMNTDEDLRIYEFEEKPANPKNNLASMGVYLFKWKVLKQYLLQDQQNPASAKDFGKNIIPMMVDDELSVFAYAFNGYWKDVGTIESLWQANMDLLSDDPPLNLNDPKWRIYTRNPNQAPHYMGSSASVTNSIINEGCSIYGEVNQSVLFYGVEIGEGSVITESILMPKVKIGRNVRIHKAIISEKVVIEDDTIIHPDQSGSNEISLISNEIEMIKKR